MPIVFARPKPDTAWDVTAASFVQSEDVSTEQSNIFDISFKAHAHNNYPPERYVL
jgi:hypothetical protein